MIARDLQAGLAAINAIFRETPLEARAALDRLYGPIERLQDLEGAAAGPLREAGARLSVTLWQAQQGEMGLGRALEEMDAEAALVERLEETIPAGRSPAFWLPQTVLAGIRNVPFTVIDGGRA